MTDANRRALEGAFWPIVSLLAAMVVFGLFVALTGRDPLEMYALIYEGAFSDAFAWQNTLQRAAPLILCALAVALPAQAGLTIIGGEGALVLGGLAASVVPLAVAGPPLLVQALMAGCAMLAGGFWIGLSGWLRHYRGVNETIASLLLSYIAIALLNHLVEGALRDPASLNKPSTRPVGDANMLGNLPGIDVHPGLAFGIILCLVLHVVVRHTGLGFATRIAGGNVRAARLAGLPVGMLILWTCVAGGACAGLAGMVEVAAVLGSANATLAAGYGYAGILVSFIARHNPLAVIPVAILIGGIGAAGSLLQRRMELPDAAMLVLQGVAFMIILGMETMTGRLKFFQPRGA
ncbi:MAG: ABC transporter permease [Burkholderiales bacterium]|nr:ABC transporter permease [Burkholderiales bacterium]